MKNEEIEFQKNIRESEFQKLIEYNENHNFGYHLNIIHGKEKSLDSEKIPIDENQEYFGIEKNNDDSALYSLFSWNMEEEDAIESIEKINRELIYPCLGFKMNADIF